MSFTPGAGTRFLVSTGASGTTPLSGPLSITGGTATTNTPVLSATQTWNNAAVTFTGWQLNVTDTASNAASLLMDLQVGGSSRFYVNKFGTIANDLALGSIQINPGGTNSIVLRGAGADWGLEVFSNVSVNVRSTVPLGWATATYATPDLQLWRDAANTLAQRNGVNAQNFNIYNSFTDASNYQRGFIGWNANVLRIGTFGLGTGAASSLHLDFITNGSNRFRIPAGTNDVAFSGYSASGSATYIEVNNIGGQTIFGRDNSAGSLFGGIYETIFSSSGAYNLVFRVNGSIVGVMPPLGGFVVGPRAAVNGALATNATDGFLYVPGCAGTPTGTPSAWTGRVPIVVDTTNNKLYFYSGGAWRDAGP